VSCSALWLGSTSAPALGVFALLFGTFYGTMVALAPALVMDLFGARSIAGILGFVYTAAGIGNLIGPAFAGYAFDLSGSYTLADRRGNRLQCRRGRRGGSRSRARAGVARRDRGAAFSWGYRLKVLRKLVRQRAGSVEVSESQGVRTLHLGGDAIQSAMRIDDPDALELDYTQAMMACALFTPEPR